MKGNQTGVAVIARELEDGGSDGEGASVAKIAMSAGAFLKIKKKKKTAVCVCATSRDKNKRSVPVLIIPHAQMWNCR